MAEQNIGSKWGPIITTPEEINQQDSSGHRDLIVPMAATFYIPLPRSETTVRDKGFDLVESDHRGGTVALIFEDPEKSGHFFCRLTTSSSFN